MPTPDLRLATDLRLACERISRRIRHESDDAVAPHQYAVLIDLANGPSTPRALADRERVSPPSMTRTLNGLEEAGLVQREPHPTDGRQIVVDLSTGGRELVAQSRARRDSWMMQHLGTLTADEREQLRVLVPLLQKLAEV